MPDILEPRCGCDDCEAAVSPGAYLATLLDYVLKHVRNNGVKIDLAYLDERFQQPFSALPMDCEAMEKQVRHARLAVEVLRAELGARPLAEPDREKNLVEGEADYRLAAYMRLLVLLGTTYEELRRARSAAPPERAALAERLGIDLSANPVGPRQDELDRLLLDPALPAADTRSLSEEALERIFGLADTGRDRLSEGVKYGDTQQQFVRWNIDQAYWNRNTDADGMVYLDLFKLAPDSFAVRVFSDAARTQVVANGERKTEAGPIRLVPANGSRLSGTVEIDYQVDTTGVSLSVVPALYGWRLRQLRTLWLREDWPVQALAGAGAALLPPLIDPQTVELADLRNARPGDPAFDLWLVRFNWLANERQKLKLAREAAADALEGFETIVAQALSTPGSAVAVADLDNLQQVQQQGERIEQRLAALGLSPGAFAFLLPLLALARASAPVIDAEWETVYDTLLGARKQLTFGAWRSEEQTQGLTLSPSYFQPGDDASAPGLANDPAVPLWLSTRAARRAWIEVLEARIAQEAALVSGIAGASADAEEFALPLLRDMLISAADVEGESVVARAKWLTKRLLLDFQTSGQQLTTRVEQAIETLQELLFALRTGQLEQNTVPAHAPLESICAVSRDGDRINLFGRGADDVLWHRVWDGRWRTWRSLGPLPGAGAGFRPSDPAALGSGGRIELVVRGSDRVLWHKRFEQGWSDWLRINDGLELVGRPAISESGPDRMNVFALRITDLETVQSQFDGTSWSAWQPSGATSSRSPAAVSWMASRVDLFLAMPSPALFQPLHRFWDGNAWQQELLDNVLASDPAAVARDVDRIDLFQNRLGHLWQKSRDGVSWQPWIDLDAALGAGAPQLTGAPSAITAAPGEIDVFALRSASPTGVWRRQFVANAWTEWTSLPADQLELDAVDFDAEWQWLGSYASWRSAEFVRLYPDNLLLPSLIGHQTPAFQALVRQTRPTVQLTPAQACEQALGYSAYLRDVSMLDVGASCQVLTNIFSGMPCKTAAPRTRNLMYMFGRTEEGKVYWCSVDSQDRSGYAQSFWDAVPLGPKDGKSPPLKVTRIVGALPWLDRSENQHHIYLFLITDEPGGSKLRRIRFDLDRYGADAPWEADIADLAEMPSYFDPATKTDKPNPVGHLTILPVQSNRVGEAPRLAVHAHLSTNFAYIRPLNPTGDDWESAPNGWDSYRVAPTYYDPGSLSLQPDTITAVEAALRTEGRNRLVYRRAQGANSRNVSDGVTGAYLCDAPSRFRGALPGASGSIFVFYDLDGQTIYREIDNGMTPGAAFIAHAGFTELARHSGSFAPACFVMQRSSLYQPTFAYFCQALAGELVGTRKFQVIPLLNALYSIPCGGSIGALQGRRSSIKQVYQQNKGVSASILQYLKEAYRLVPQQLGLNQQASGEYVAALDWFTTVYDYRAKPGERYIDYGLAIDAGLPDSGVYQHPEDWLLDPLNPHAVALTRRYAYTRFAIASLIRCFNEFADAEFTHDSSESLARARLLYTTALELCDVPEMRQPSGECEALLAALKIQPGEVVAPEVAAAVGETIEELTQGKVGSVPESWKLLQAMKAMVQNSNNWATVLPELQMMKQQALKLQPVAATTGSLMAERPALMAKMVSGMLTDPVMEARARRAAEVALTNAADWLNEIKETN